MKTAARPAPATDPASWPPYATWPSAHYDSTAPPTSPKHSDTTPGTHSAPSNYYSPAETQLCRDREYGVPAEVIVTKLKDLRFEPFGRTDDPDIPQAASVMDWL